MKPLRSVDLTTMTESGAAIERSDVCAVPAAAVVGEAMVALILADALIEKFGGDSIDELTTVASRPGPRGVGERFRQRTDRTRARCSGRFSDTASGPCTHRPNRVTALRRRAAAPHRRHGARPCTRRPGIGLAATQVGVPLRVFVVDLSVGRDPVAADRDGQSGVRRARRHAARGRGLPERAGLQRDGRPPGPRRGSGPGSRTATAQTLEGSGLLARAFQHEMDHLDGRVFIDRLRGIKRDVIVRKIQKLQRSGKW